MSIKALPQETSTDTRTIRAAEAKMAVLPEGDGSGRFVVCTGLESTYLVDLPKESCTCGDYEHRQPAGGCKYIRRV